MMSMSMLRHRIAIVAIMAFAGAALSPVALADASTTVTFAANNPWAQEVGTVDHYKASHDYTVAVDAGKTLQINLLTHNPNVFFKIADQTHDEQLVDTMQTGATTWSQVVAAPATYTIHVYVDPAAMERGDSAKYALQIGQYGAADMQPATTTVTFQPNTPWAQQVGKIDATATAHDYSVAVTAGNTLQVNLVANDPNVRFKVEDANQAVLVDSGTTGAKTWSTPVTMAATYTVRVYVDPAAMPPGKASGYALQIGQYPTNRAQPASGASAAAPAAASSSAN